MSIVRSKAYLSHVRSHGCLRCGQRASAHHLKMVEAMGQGIKVSDEWTVPLCHQCHMRLHAFGDEQTWWDLEGIDPIEWARRTWKEYDNGAG